MKYNFENNLFTIYLEGKIDTTTAEDVGKEIDSIRSENPEGLLVLDFEDVVYVSSAGLRQILRIKKKEKDFKIVNVTSEVYEVFDITGFTEMMDIEKGYRKLEVADCEVLGEGSNGIVYRYSPDIIVKVYKNKDVLEDIKRERELARTALVMGINTAIPYDVVKVGDYFGSVFELLDSDTLSAAIMKDKDRLDEYVKIFVDLLKEIHASETDNELLPPEKEIVLGWAKYLEGHIDDAHYEKLISLIEAVPDTNHMIHGDFHTNNVFLFKGEAILIDMDTIATGHPVFEMGSIYNAYQGFSIVNHDQVQNFLKIDYETASRIWKLILKLYYETDDEAEITMYEMRAKIVGLTRILRRTLRREPENTVLIEESRKQLLEAIDGVDSLV